MKPTPPLRLEDRRAGWNSRALARLEALPPGTLPTGVLAHALRSRWMPRTARAAVDAYWRARPIRAERLCRALAARSGTPAGWSWGAGRGGRLPVSFRIPPLPFREPAHAARGQCVVCGQPVYRLGWHRDLWSDPPNQRAAWHSCCVVAWKFWVSPSDYRPALSKLQRRKCALSGRRLLRTAEVDHRIPLFRVWREHGDLPWPELLSFWGTPNLQVVNRDVHLGKSVGEARFRSAAKLKTGSSLQPDQAV